ncbi:MRP3-like protein [Mya arenaria]|uniref:MRP3-like protein n=1 Tax=Mya arenaria TaxID=6604 RepID=A0ABY7DJ28_MYAAR|nr:MRP3-like protein [Mya arenaria]
MRNVQNCWRDFGLFNVCGTTFLYIANIQAGKILHHTLLRNVMASPMEFFDVTPSGRLLNRFGKDLDTIDNIITRSIHYVLHCFLESVATVIVVGRGFPWILIVMLPLAVFYFVVQVCLLL